MRISKNTPVYSRVAYDIASQIANGKLAEGQRFSGRSLMASQYAASSETIRRAMNLLSNMHIIEIQQNVGATVLSRQHAIAYVEQYQVDNDLRALKARLKELITQRDQFESRYQRYVSKNHGTRGTFQRQRPISYL